MRVYKHNPPLSPQSPRIRPRSFLKLPPPPIHIQSQCEDLIYNNTNPRSGIDFLKYPILPPGFQNVTKRPILRRSSPRKCVFNPPKHQDDACSAGFRLSVSYGHKYPANHLESVNLASLSVPQLRALQTRLTSELEHLTTSHTKLRAAQAKFRDCVRSINDGVIGNEKKGTDGRDEILVPLTSSLYVKGRLTDREKVLVDVGTGFYVEKVCGGGAIFNDVGGGNWSG